MHRPCQPSLLLVDICRTNTSSSWVSSGEYDLFPLPAYVSPARQSCCVGSQLPPLTFAASAFICASRTNQAIFKLRWLNGYTMAADKRARGDPHGPHLRITRLLVLGVRGSGNGRKIKPWDRFLLAGRNELFQYQPNCHQINSKASLIIT